MSVDKMSLEMALSALQRIAGGTFPNASNLVMMGDWQGFVDALQQIAAEAVLAVTGKPHDLYQTSDTDAPDVIKDRNGDVVLGLCRVCGQGEADLADHCPGKRADPPKWVPPALHTWANAEDGGDRMYDAARAHVREMLKIQVDEIEPTIIERLLSAYADVCRVSGSSLLAGERRAQNADQRGRVYRCACVAHAQIGDVIQAVSGTYPSLDENGDAYLPQRTAPESTR